MGFAALNLFNCGCRKLMEGGLKNLLDKHTLRVEILQEMEDEQQAAKVRANANANANSETNPNPIPLSPIPTCETCEPITTPLQPSVSASEDSPMHLGDISDTPPSSPTPITIPSSPVPHSSSSSIETSKSDTDSNADSIVALDDVDELDLYTEKHLLRLEAGPELTLSIDPASG
ncbi:hypothetical protein BT96DRAFT_996962 [Gymnopus androsaceus JB14]|uniref:Uncharacterized protein n=1 Tax=Gymnopus androsaceus JB14 TaxID=1447944 RepID=A0A6A4HGA6_9AGAR|nr:hypothetical protein BT96DRAFT_996962 [Gymnopus androsaceus JB14]